LARRSHAKTRHQDVGAKDPIVVATILEHGCDHIEGLLYHALAQEQSSVGEE
jgi:peptide deformylase